jgi:hypothetical protein
MSLLGLLSLMTGVAFVLAGVRLILPRDLANWNITGDGIFALLTQISGTMLVTSAVITCYHVPRPAWLNLALAVGFILVIATLHLVAYGQSHRFNLLPPEPLLQVKPSTAWCGGVAAPRWRFAPAGSCRLRRGDGCCPGCDIVNQIAAWPPPRPSASSRRRHDPAFWPKLFRAANLK